MENSAAALAILPSLLAMEPSVELDLTVLRPARRQSGVDVRVTAPVGTSWGEVLPLLAEVVGTEPACVSCGGVPLGPDGVVGMPPLVHGATLVLDEPSRPAPRSTAPTDIVVVAGPDAGRRHPVAAGGVVVGRAAGIGLSLDDDHLSRRHVSITPVDSGFRVVDLSSTNGTRCGDAVLGGAATRRETEATGDGVVVDGGDLIAIGSSLLRPVRSVEATAPVHARGDGRVTVNRAPRTTPPLVAVTVAAPTPPTPPRRARVPWLAAVLPLPFAGVLAVVFGPQMLAFALLSPLMVVGNVVADRIGVRRDHAREVATHEDDLRRRRAELDDARARERVRRWRDTPDPAVVLATASGPGVRLWERRPGASGFGRVRVGVGALPSLSGWAPPGGAPVEHPPLRDLPVEVDLTEVGGLGIAGPRGDVEAVVRHVLGQVATLHSPRDVRVVACSNGPDSTLGWARWLPHTTAYGDVRTCLDALREVVTAREEERVGGQSTTRPAILVVIPEAEGDLGGGELVDLLDRGRDLGVWSLVGAGRASALPSSCHAVLGLGQGVGDGASRLDVDGREPVVAFVADRVGWWWGERVGRSLAPLVDGSSGADPLPDSVDLFDLTPWLGHAACTVDDPADRVVRLVDHWRAAERRPVARLGRLAGEAWTIDLATDGPHVLVGGTTGSGKSELLRTLVASLALESSPEDVSFVLVDYKGGSAFGECAELPHTVGLVTNLDEGLAQRALVSLGAEITRREELLAGSGARDFDAYRERGGALPRLVIVVDEFRLLAEELPDFVSGVVSLAAVGRSLGVHLVLATQRPAGAVTADIQANVNLRIAMRMRDVADSTDVIGAPDAARIPPSRPGRGFAGGGDGELVEFQAARLGGGSDRAGLRLEVLDHTGALTSVVVSAASVTGASLDPSSTSAAPDLPQSPDSPTGLGRVASLTVAAAAALGIAAPHRPWLPPLPERLDPRSMGVDGIGLVDLPALQRQEVLAHLAGDGHWLLVGGPRSGRTTALRTVLASHVARVGSPTHAYVIDTAGELADLEQLPHVGTVVHAQDVTRCRRLLDRLRQRTVRDVPAPALLLVDGWERLGADKDLALGGLRDDLLDLLRAGDPTLRAVVTGDRSTLTGRLSTLVSETFLLPLADPGEAAYAGLSRRDLPSTRAPGRAVRLRDRAEVQLTVRDPLAEAAPRAAELPHPIRVPRLPALVDHARLVSEAAAPDHLPPATDLIAVGISGDTGLVAHLDLTRLGRRLLVAGHPRSGRSTTLAAIGASAVLAGRTVAVVEPGTGWVSRAVHAAAAKSSRGHAGPAPARPEHQVRGEVLRIDPWDGESLVAAKRRHPALVVLVDDADRLDGTPVEPVLLEIAALVDRDRALLVAASTVASATAQFRGVLPAVARAQAGILLGPRVPGDGEAFGIRAPRGVATVAGRALVVGGREAHEIQVARVVEGSEGRASSPDPAEHLRRATRCA